MKSTLLHFVFAALMAVLLTGNCWAAEKQLTVCATEPTLGSLAKTIGGTAVQVTVFAKGTEDPHFVQAKPSFIKALSKADALILNGLELELGWLPAIIQGARNRAVLPGGPGYIDASSVIAPQSVPTTPVDRSMGDIHALGNPHYLLDPLSGLAVARLLKDRFSNLMPSQKEYFAQQLLAFQTILGERLVGKTLAKKYDSEKLALLHSKGGLVSFLKSQGDFGELGGWLGRLANSSGIRVVGDHDMYPYLASRLQFVVEGHLEPRPGFPPTTKHLKNLIAQMRADEVALILTNAYYDPKHAMLVEKNTDAKVVRLAHQVNARPGTGSYLEMLDYNFREIARAIGIQG